MSDPAIYLDHAASCGERPSEVLEAMSRAMLLASANPGRSSHARSLDAARLVEEARSVLARFVNAGDAAKLIFTKNATESLNVVLWGLDWSELSTVLVSSFEHNAVMRPLRALEHRGRIRLEFIPPGDGALVDVAYLNTRLDVGDVSVVCVMAASNVTGQCAPLAEVGAACQRHGAFFMVDGAQGAGIVPLDVERQRIDALALTGHKSLYGPQGIGALYLARPEQVEPLVHGGTGSRSEHELQPTVCPDKFEAGTANVPGIAGLAAAIRYIGGLGGALREHHQTLRAQLLERLESIAGLRVLGTNRGPHVGTVSFVVDGLCCSDLARALDRRGVMVRFGLTCAPRAHRTLGSFDGGGAIRVSVSWFTRAEDLHRAAERIVAAVDALRDERKSP